MVKLYLTGNRVFEITEEQSIRLSRAIMVLPDFKDIKLGGVIFKIRDIDVAAAEKAKLPQQMNLGVRVKTVDKSRKKVSETH